MSGRYNAGTVDVKITADSSDFEEEINRMRKESKKVEDQLTKSSKKIEKQMNESSQNTSNFINNLMGSVEQLKMGQEQLYGTTSNVSKGLKEEVKTIKKLSNEVTANTKSVKSAIKADEELVKANEKVAKSYKKVEKQSQFALTNLEKQFSTKFRKMVNDAHSPFTDNTVPLKPIFDNLKEQYESSVRDLEEFKRLWNTAMRTTGAYLKQPNKQSNGLETVKFGKNDVKFDRIARDKMKSLDEFMKTIESASAVAKSSVIKVEESVKQVGEEVTKIKTPLSESTRVTNEFADATTQSTLANKKNIESTKQRIAINKQLVNSMEHFNPKQMEELYNYLKPLSNPDLSFGKVSLNRLKKEFADFAEGVEDFDKVLSNSLHMMGAYTEKIGRKKLHDKQNVLFNLSQLKKPMLEVAEATETTTSATEKVIESTKKSTEAIKENTLAYNENFVVRDAMLKQAHNFLSKSARLKGGNYNSIVGQTGGRWVDKGMLDEDFRVRIFDLEQFRKNINETFEGIIPAEQLKKNLKELEKELSLSKVTGNFDAIYDYDYEYLKNQIKGIDLSLEELIEKFNGVSEGTVKAVEETDKLTQANEKNIESTKERIKITKELENQLRLNRNIYSLLDSSNRKRSYPLEDFKLFTNTRVDRKFFDSHLEETMKNMGLTLKELDNEMVVDASNLKRPILDISELLVESSNKVIDAKKRETEEFKKYTEYELTLIRNLNRELKYLKREKAYSSYSDKSKESSSLVPIDHWKNSGGHQSEYFRNYSSILKSVKRNSNWVDRGIKGAGKRMFLLNNSDVATALQKRLVELMNDLGVTVSDVTDKEFKKIRSKLSGKMVEYLDISELTPELVEKNEQWIKEASNLLFDKKWFEKEVSKHLRGARRGSWYDLSELKKIMDRQSQSHFKEYGFRKNPYITDFIKENDLQKYYNQAINQIQDYHILGHKELGDNPAFLYHKVTQGIKLLNRVLEETNSDLEVIDVNAKEVTNTFENLHNTLTKISATRKGIAPDNFNLKGIEKTTTNIKQLGETTKYSATQLQLLNEMFDHFQYRKDLGDTNAPFVATYKNWEQQYKNLLTNLDPKFSNRIKKQFQNTFQQLANDLGVTFSPETVLLAEGSQKRARFLGQLIGSYDLTNLISEEEFNRLIGKTEELSVAEEKATVTTQQLGEASKYTATQLKILTDIFHQANSESFNSKGAYLGLENKYIRDITGTDMKSVISEKKLRSRFQRQILPLIERLGIGWSVGSNLEIPEMDLTNLISEEEFNKLIGKTEELNNAQEKTTIQTRIARNEITLYDAQLMNLVASMDGLNAVNHRYSDTNKKIIDDLTRMARANELASGSFQKTKQALEAINQLKTKNHFIFGFEGQDLYDKKYIRNTLRALTDPTGISKIAPKDRSIRKYTNAQKRFLYDFYDSIQRGYFKNVDKLNPSTLKIPSKKNLDSRLGINYPFQTDYLKDYSDLEDGYKQFVKDYQTTILKLLKDLNIEISTELANNDKRIRVWIEELGKYKNIGSLDISKMLDLGSSDDFQRIIDKATIYDESLLDVAESIKKVGDVEEKTTESTKKLSEGVNTATESADKLKSSLDNVAPKTVEVSEELKSIGTVTVTTTSKVGDLGLELDTLSAQEEKATEATNRLKDANMSLQKSMARYPSSYMSQYDVIGYEFGLKSTIQTMGELTSEFSVVRGEEEKTTQSTNKLGNALKNIINLVETKGKSLYGGSPTPIGTGRIKFINDISINDAKTQADLLTTLIGTASSQASGLKGAVDGVRQLQTETNKATKNTKELSQAYQEIWEKGQYFGISMYQAYSKIIPATIKAREELVKLGEVQQKVIKIIEHSSGGAKSPLRFLNLFEGQIKNIRPYINELEARATKAFEVIKQNASNMREPFERLPMVIKRATDGEKEFERQTRRTGETIKQTSSYYNNIFRQLNQWDKEHSITRPIDSRNLKNWDLWSDGFARSGSTLANTTKSLRTFDTSVLQTANDIKVKLVEAMKLFYENATILEQKIPDKAFDSWKQAIAEIEGFERRYLALQQRMYDLSRGRGYWQNQGKVNTGYGKTLSDQAILKWIESNGMGNATIGGQNIKQIIENLSKSQRSVLEASLLGKNGRVNVVGYSDYIANITKIKESLESASVHSDRFKQSLMELATAIKLTNTETNRFAMESEKAVKALTSMAESNERFTTITTDIEKVIQVLNHFSSISTKNKESLAGLSEQAVLLKERFNILNGEFGRGAISEQAYEQAINKLIADLEKLGTTATQTIRKLNLENLGTSKESLTALANAIKETGSQFNRFSSESKKAINSLTQMAEANERFNQKTDPTKINRIIQTLEHFSNASEKNKKALIGLSEQATILKEKFNVLNTMFREGMLSEEAYDSEIKKLIADIERLGTVSTESIRKLNMGEELQKSMGKTDKYVDNLYRGLQKARSVIISMKTILRMMGGMEVWNFAFGLIESAKQTYIAKNEMESLLEQNTKVNTSGVDAYNRALDETAKKYQKINKYSLGETGASIGLEFNLNAQQMAKSLDVIAMIQSEYVRAGRTTEEASLAVKDILQGEFMRLSRETGVGKDDLQEKYGWNGDTSDVLGLMKALEKAGKERHWDIFAGKATSLNDVLTITQSRFSEFGADLASNSEPLITGAFNSILGAVESLKKGIEGMGTFGKTAFSAGALYTGIMGLSTAYMVLAKNMGVVDIATVGWTKSLFSSVLQLNKSEVAVHGFWKALTANLSGVKANELAETRWTKALMGRILGVKQSILAEKGYMTALVNSKGALMKHTGYNNIAKISSMGLAQKVAYLTNNIKLQEVQTWSTSKAILRTATSWKVLGTAIKGIIGIGIIAWLASVASWTDKVKKNVAGFDDLVDNGAEKVKQAQSNYDNIVKEISDNEALIDKNKANGSDTTALERKHNKLLQDKYTAYKNIGIIQRANNYAQEKSQRLERKRSWIDADIDARKAKALMAVGNTKENAELFASDAWNEAKAGAYYRNKALDEYKNTYDDLIVDAEKHGKYLKEQKVDQEKINQFMADYFIKAQEASEHIKQFNEGDIWAGAYYALDRLTLEWIKFTNSAEGAKFFESLKNWWDWAKPSIDSLIASLKEIGKLGIQAFNWLSSTSLGNTALTIGGIATGIGLLALKFKGVRGVLKDLGKTIWDRIKDFRKLNEETGVGGKKPNTKTTPEGKKNPDYIPETSDVGLKEGLMSDLKGNVRRYANYATQLAFMMGLITEAIYLIQAPMWALAETGKTFKAKEKSIRAGIEGLKLITPTIIAVLIPVLALTKVFDHYGDILNKGSLKTLASTAIGIATGLLLVAEAIVMVTPSIWALGYLGDQYQGMESQVKKGAEAMKFTGESLQYLAPFVPMMIVGIASWALLFSGAGSIVGGIALASVTLGIATGMLWIAETIWSLEYPLNQIASLGSKFSDLSGVKKGAEAIKTCSEAMTSVEEATRAMALVKWEVLAGNIAEVIAQLTGHDIGDDLVKLTEEGGFLDDMEKFAQGFNAKSFTAISPEKATAFKTVADSLGSLNSALESAKNAIANLPAEFKNGGNGQPLLGYDMDTDKYSIQGNVTANGVSADGGTTSYFDQLKQPIEDLAKFMEWFNGIEITAPAEDKVSALTSSATMVEQINNAITKVKDTMGNIAMGNIATNIAQTTGDGSAWSIPFGGIGALTGIVSGVMGGGTGDYKSSIGSQLYEMEMVLTDLNTFNNNVAGIGATNGGGAFTEGSGGNAQALAGMVTAVSTAISQLESTLAKAVPTIKQNAKNIGSGIGDGIKEGMGNLTTLVIPPLTTAMNTMKAYATTYGKGVGYNLTQGFKAELKVAQETGSEILRTTTYLDGKKQEFYDKGKALGEALSQGYKDGQDMHSPGIIARSTQEELGRVASYFDNALFELPSKAFSLGSALSSNFNFDLNLGNFQLPNLDTFQQGLNTIMPMVDTVKTNVSTKFDEMKLRVGGALSNIATNASTKYQSMVTTTRTNMGNMLSATTKNIGGIRTSWAGMQSALIASAEHIRSQTTQKINKLKTNMGDFWNKIKHPDQLVGSAGGKPTGTIRRRYAGASMFRPRISYDDPSKHQKEGLLCRLLTGSPCYSGYSGGWDFNWTPKISRKFKGWDTHFNKYKLDNHLNVGSFENSNFPVKGRADVFRDYISAVIGATTYDYYYDHRYSPAEALRRGSFNCFDGMLIIEALAHAFGLGTSRGSGSWGSDGHVWSIVDGIGVIDATAIQRGYGFKSPKVKGYSGGRPKPSGSSPNEGTTVNFGDINVYIDGDVENAQEKGREIADEINDRIMKVLRRNPSTGL